MRENIFELLEDLEKTELTPQTLRVRERSSQGGYQVETFGSGSKAFEDSQAWQGSGAKLDIYAFPLSIKSQTITAKRAGKAEKAVAANKFNAGT